VEIANVLECYVSPKIDFKGTMRVKLKDEYCITHYTKVHSALSLIPLADLWSGANDAKLCAIWRCPFAIGEFNRIESSPAIRLCVF